MTNFAAAKKARRLISQPRSAQTLFLSFLTLAFDLFLSRPNRGPPWTITTVTLTPVLLLRLLRMVLLLRPPHPSLRTPLSPRRSSPSLKLPQLSRAPPTSKTPPLLKRLRLRKFLRLSKMPPFLKAPRFQRPRQSPRTSLWLKMHRHLSLRPPFPHLQRALTLLFSPHSSKVPVSPHSFRVHALTCVYSP